MICGVKSNFEKVQKGLGEYFFAQAEKYATNTFQIDGESGQKETFSSVNERSSRMALSLKKSGITSEDTVVTCLYNSLDTVIPHIAVLYLGSKFAALDPIQTDKDWTVCLGIARPKVVFVAEEQLKRMERCLDDLGAEPEIIVDGESEVYKTLKELMGPCENEDSFRPEIVKDCRETAIISFSSGTTGPPKGVCHSHFGLINMTISYLQMDVCDPRVMLFYSTFYWITSVLALVNVFYSGGCRVMPRKFQPKEALRMIQDYQVTYCLIPPKATREILNVKNAEEYDTSSLFHYTSTGETIAPDCLLKVRKLFKHSYVTSAYGSSELGWVTAFDLSRDKRGLEDVESVGRCMQDVDIKIVDEKSKKELGPNQEGEIWVRSPYCITGYHNTDTPFTRDAQGFIKTGDVGYYDKNEFIHIVGRCDEMFKYGVLKVVPSHWELVLEEHPAIEEAGVFGLPAETAVLLPAACVVLKKGVVISEEEIQRFLMDKMTSLHRLGGGIKFVGRLPKTSSWKLKRRELVNIYNQY